MKKNDWLPIGSEVEIVVGSVDNVKAIKKGNIIDLISDKRSAPYGYKVRVYPSGEILFVKPSHVRIKKDDSIKAYDRAMKGV